jgi:hypothetical protein
MIPRVGSYITFHIKAATISEIMSGKMNTDRKKAAPRIFWLSNIAIPNPRKNSIVTAPAEK